MTLTESALAGIGAIATLVIAIAAWRASERATQVSAVYGTMIERFADPQVKVEGWESAGESRGSFREWKSWAREQQRANPKSWAEASTASAVKGNYPIENKIAYNIANGLNDLGTVVFNGGLSLNMVMASMSDVIIDDWIICQDWIARYRETEGMRSKSCSTIHFHRRFGEALVAISLIYLKDRWNYEPAKNIVGSVADPESFIVDLIAADASTMPWSVWLNLFKFMSWGARLSMTVGPLLNLARLPR